MRPYVLHLCILAVVMIPGIALFIMETLSPETGGFLFRKYDATKIYWIGLMGYATVSTSVVFALNIIFSIKKKPFNKKAVISGHALPVVFIWVFIQLGLHDLIQNIWQQHVEQKKSISKHVHKKKDRQGPRVPGTPLSKHLYYKSSEDPIEQEKQTEFADSENAPEQ
jgi:hypothetical protein